MEIATFIFDCHFKDVYCQLIEAKQTILKYIYIGCLANAFSILKTVLNICLLFVIENFFLQNFACVKKNCSSRLKIERFKRKKILKIKDFETLLKDVRLI